MARNRSTLWLNSDEGGGRAVEATLEPRRKCDVTGTTPVPSDEAGTTRYEDPQSLRPDLHTTRHYLFPGGCITYRFAFSGDVSSSLLFEADQALRFQPRQEIVESVSRRAGLDLCGAGVVCPGGAGS